MMANGRQGVVPPVSLAIGIPVGQVEVLPLFAPGVPDISVFRGETQTGHA